MIVEAFDNAWHVLRHWAEVGHEYFVFEHRERVPEPRPVPREDLPPDAICGLDYFLVPALAPYWADKLGRTEFNAYQASARGGQMRVTLDGDRVHLAGRAVTMMRGELLH